MFFIISLNPTKHTVKIIGHALTLEQAIEVVSERANDYVKSKNGPVMNRGEEDVKLTDRVFFFTRKSPQHDYQIDIYRQQTLAVRGWTGSTTYKDETTLVRRICFTEYAAQLHVIPDAPPPMPIASFAVPNEEKRKPPMKLTTKNTIGGFPSDVLQSLKECERFQQSKISAEMNKLPPPFKHTIFASESESSSFEEDEDV